MENMEMTNQDMRDVAVQFPGVLFTAGDACKENADPDIQQVGQSMRKTALKFAGPTFRELTVEEFEHALWDVEEHIHDLEDFQKEGNCQSIIDALEDLLLDGKYVMEEYRLEKMRVGA